jgi:histidine ammonia-lyase
VPLQVLGAVWDAIRFAATTAAVELNASTDNPLVFDNGDVLSGNFTASPSRRLDVLAMPSRPCRRSPSAGSSAW